MKPLVVGLGIAAGLMGAALAVRAALGRDGTSAEGAVAAPAFGQVTASSSAGDPEGPVVVPAPSEKAMRYYRSGNVIWAIEQLLGLALPALLLFSGLSARMRTFAAAIGRGHFYPTLVVYLVLLSALLFLIQLPLSYYVGYLREHAYGLSTQRLSKWAGDELKGLAVGLVVGALIIWVPYLLLARSPTRWWLWTGALSLPFFTLVLLVTPVFIAPLFNKFGPMKDQALEGEVLAVAARAGVEGARVYEVEKSVDTEKVNAYVTGVGNTKRIVLWDTLLEAPRAPADPVRRRARARPLRPRARLHQHPALLGADAARPLRRPPHRRSAAGSVRRALRGERSSPTPPRCRSSCCCCRCSRS